MWFIRRILWCDTKAHDAVVLLQKVKKPLKTRNTDLLREWYKNEYPEKPPKGLSKVLGGLGRLRNWLNGKVTHWVEDIISNLRQKDSERYKTPLEEDTIVARGWFPSLHSCIDYELDIELSEYPPKIILSAAGLPFDTPFYKIKNVLFMVKREFTIDRLDPMILFIARRHGKKRRVDGKMKKNMIRDKLRKLVPWGQVNKKNYRLYVFQRCPSMESVSKKILLKFFETYYDMPLWLCCIFQKPYVYTVQDNKDRLAMYNTMITHPLSLGLSTDDTDRLLIMLGRSIMSFNLKKEMDEANDFKRELNNNTALLTTKFKASSYIVQLPSGHMSLKRDVEIENMLAEWLDKTDIYNGNPNLNDLQMYPEDTLIVTNHVDEIFNGFGVLSVEEIEWWKNAEPTRPYIIYAAHRIGLDTWVKIRYYMKSAPVALIGRLDQYTVGRGQIFRDMGKLNGFKIRLKPLCSTIHMMTFADFMVKNIKVNQIYYKCEDVKNKAKVLGMDEKCDNKIWIQHPKRLRTVKNITERYIYLMEEEKPIERHGSEIDDGIFIKPWQTTKSVPSAVVLCEKMSDFDIHHVQTCVKNDVYFIKMDSIPALSGVSVDSVKSRVTVIGCKT